MNKKFNYSAILVAIESRPDIINKFKLDSETLTEDYLKSLDMNSFMDLVMTLSSPIKNLN